MGQVPPKTVGSKSPAAKFSIFLSPSAVIAPGERTGKFRLGKDQLITHDKGSNISWEDYAIAAVDELEKPAHIRERFTVGY